MLTWIVLALAGFAGGFWVAYRMTKKPADRTLPRAGAAGALEGREGTPLLERGLADVRTGDVIQHDGRDFLVEGVVHYEEDGHRWRGARLMDGRDVRWLVVGLDRGPGVHLRLFSTTNALELSSYPADTLRLGKDRFQMARRGTATCQLTGDLSGLPGAQEAPKGSALRCRWWLYETAGSRCLLVEQWGDTYRVLLGEKIPGDHLDFLAGS